MFEIARKTGAMNYCVKRSVYLIDRGQGEDTTYLNTDIVKHFVYEVEFFLFLFYFSFCDNTPELILLVVQNLIKRLLKMLPSEGRRAVCP